MINLGELKRQAILANFEKGKKATIGEIRTWNGKKYQKQASGWIPVKEGSNNTQSKDQKTIEELSALLGNKIAKITIEKNSKGDRIVKVNGQTAFNLEDRSTADRKTALERAYKASSTKKEFKTGDTHEHNGKKYKKQANGKWLEVSEHGMTKKEHVRKYEEHERSSDRVSNDYSLSETEQKKRLDYYGRYMDMHYKEIKQLSDKEHSDKEVGLENNSPEKKYSNIPNVDRVNKTDNIETLHTMANDVGLENFQNLSKDRLKSKIKEQVKMIESGQIKVSI